MTSNDICSDIIIEILSWLPVDSLLQFKSVCKSWLSLITNPKFAKLHSLHIDHNKPTILFTTNKGYALKSIDEVLVASLSSSSIIETHEFVSNFSYFPQQYVDIVGSCNGLICIHAYDECDKNNILYLWNPSTKEFKLLPSPVEGKVHVATYFWNPSTKKFKLLPSLVEDQDHVRKYYFKTIRYGFGYDHIIDDYKVIATSGYYGEEDKRFDNSRFILCDSEVVMVYTLGTNSWRQIQCNKPCKFELYSVFNTRLSTKTWTYVNGAFHRIVQSSSCICSIISFDIVDEVYREVPNPECVDSKSMHLWELTVLRGCLCVSTTHSKFFTDKYMEVWMMVDYGVKESWTELFNITSYVADISRFRPVWLHKNGEVMVGNYPEFVIYDPKHNQVKRLKPWSSKDSCWFETTIFTGSLVSLKSHDE